MDESMHALVFSQVFKNLLKFKTRILVTSSLPTLAKVDRVAVLKDGKIEAIGPFDEIRTEQEVQEILETLGKVGTDLN
jgi:ABC-type bacteriocin/lantibiotic exporter with double-glycine peptidase domain